MQANSKDIDMQFGIQKWEIVEEGYKYLEFTEAQKNKEQKMKNIPDRIFKRNSSCFTVETKLSQQNQSYHYLGCISNLVWGRQNRLEKE